MHIRKLSPENKLWAVALLVTVCVFLVLLTLIPVSKWLWLGWLYGCLCVLGGLWVSTFLLTSILKMLKTKMAGFWASIGRTCLTFVLQGGLFILLIVSNNLYFGKTPFGGSVYELVHGILPFPTYVAGLSVVMLASITSLLLENKKKEV